MHRRGYYGRRHGHFHRRPYYGGWGGYGYGRPYWGGWGYRPFIGYPYYNPVLWR